MKAAKVKGTENELMSRDEGCSSHPGPKKGMKQFQFCSGETMAKKRILLVDDSEVVRSMASDELQKRGYKVITAANGLEANRYLFQKDQPDLVIIDVMIPLLNGNKTAKLIKENQNTSQIPILLLSSKPAEELQRLATESGADGFIQKPLTPRLLVEKIEETLRLRVPGRQGSGS